MKAQRGPDGARFPEAEAEARRHAGNRAVAESGIFTALFLGLGMLFVYVPNIEFITFMTFLSAWLFPLRRSLFIVGAGEFLFSVLNPLGSSLAYPWLFGAQMLALLSLVAAVRLLRPFLKALQGRAVFPWLLGLTGLLMSVWYDLLTSLSFPLASGFDRGQILASLAAGIPFYAVHILSNVLIFFIIMHRTLDYVEDRGRT